METAGKLATLAALGAGGYFGYRYWKQRQLEAQAKALAAKTGVPYKDILAALGSAACKAYLKSQTGTSTSLGNSACDLGGKLASVVILKGGKLAFIAGKGAGGATVAAGKAIGSGVVSAGKAVGNVASSAVSKLKFWGLEGLSC